MLANICNCVLISIFLNKKVLFEFMFTKILLVGNIFTFNLSVPFEIFFLFYTYFDFFFDNSVFAFARKSNIIKKTFSKKCFRNRVFFKLVNSFGNL